MKADLTRQSFDPLKHFSRVLMQQGRVQLDADWNEQADILLYAIRRFIADVIPGGGGTGFGIATIDTNTAVPDDFAIGAGTYYVDGILCELSATPVPVSVVKGKQQIKVATWTVDEAPFAAGQYLELSDDAAASGGTTNTAVTKITGLDYPNATLTLDDVDLTAFGDAKLLRARRVPTYRSQSDLLDAGKFDLNGIYQVYLDVWERVITSLEDDSIREVALNGPDTAVRTRVVWQIKTTPYVQPPVRTGNGSGGVNDGPRQCMTVQALRDAFQPWTAGLLRARTQPGQVSSDPCTIAPDSKYRGPLNQLYRVEIHTGSGDASRPPSFKWSRENGAVVFAIDKIASGGGVTTVTLADMGRDDRFGLTEGDFVEVQDDRTVLANTVGTLLAVQSIDRTNLIVTLAGSVAGTVAQDAALHPLLRRWDHKSGDPATGGLDIGADGAAEIQTGTWLNLEDGVQVWFEEMDGATYRPSDYWLIPARVATGDVIWPTETGTDAQGNAVVNRVAKPPAGIVHHYAPLGVLTIGGDGKSTPGVTLCQESASKPRQFGASAEMVNVSAQRAPEQSVPAPSAPKGKT